MEHRQYGYCNSTASLLHHEDDILFPHLRNRLLNSPQEVVELGPCIKIDAIAHSNLLEFRSPPSFPQYDDPFNFPEVRLNSVDLDLKTLSQSSSVVDALNAIAPSVSCQDSPRSLQPSNNQANGNINIKGLNKSHFEKLSPGILSLEPSISSSLAAERVRLTKELLQGSLVPCSSTTTVSSSCSISSSESSPEGSVASLQTSWAQQSISDESFKTSSLTIPESKHDSQTQSHEDSDMDCKHGTKKRKVQQKRVVCVPIVGDLKQRIEAPPSDLWAWRKYGQKPIKGSPYPRGYYRCSSSKGCSARKQVERNRSDPSTLIITYTSDHNHPLPTLRTASSSSAVTDAGAANLLSSMSDAEPNTSEDDADLKASENLFSSIINLINAGDEPMIPFLEPMQAEESLSFNRYVDLRLSSCESIEEGGLFDDLGELPELSSLLTREFLDGKLCPELANANLDSQLRILGWPSSTLFVQLNKVVG